MNNELLGFIRTLSENDTKNLCQKALKTTEEVGELAKSVLPYENAAGTLHRFIDRGIILENAVDTMLCALSIAYDLKFTDEEIEQMMLDKARKWSGLQLKESKAKFPLPFEMHITIKVPENSDQSFLDSFNMYCKGNKIKPIIIDLEKGGEMILRDVMTSSVHFGNNNTALEAANRIAFDLTAIGYTVVRVKIETVPWHPAAPCIGDGELPPNTYFESHLRIVTTEDRKPVLEEIAYKAGAHLSRNFFKKLNEKEYIIMMTLRSNQDCKESFELLTSNLKDELDINDFEVDKVEIEFAIYDTKTSHDSKWIIG